MTDRDEILRLAKFARDLARGYKQASSGVDSAKTIALIGVHIGQALIAKDLAAIAALLRELAETCKERA